MTTNGIGVVGAGISGLTLALRLQQLGVDVTLYSESTADQMRRGRLPNTVARMKRTLARERALGSEHFAVEGSLVGTARISITGEPPLEFGGSLDEPFHGLDFRLLLPALLDDFTARGGRLVMTEPSPGAAEVDAWSARHELMVVAAGRRSVAELFPRDESRSPYDRPQRSLLAGLYTGIAHDGFGYNVSPGVCEIFQMPMWTRHGLTAAMLVEAIPGGPMEAVTRLSYQDDPEMFTRTLEKLLGEHAPRIAERIDSGSFGPLGPDDLLQGAVTPVVRTPVAALSTGRVALAIGDAWITNDPVTGQGANLGSHCAWVAAEAIAAGGPYDERFAWSVADTMWEVAGPVTEWSNAFLQPPAEHLLRLFVGAAMSQDVAGLFINLFSDPVSAWALFSDPAKVDAVLAAHDLQVPAPVAS
ncbi:NAD(P)-binding protein [Planotetraspora sp. A-T 1434]|uniref:styrene monooxygenase/indole monooxygenase family protein n=1 Tax=Planotetraspora sp. A-T 1434 TaxID=2979219 RepID=UPI0021BED70A|nr:styrene monooxygenase/indole monooxygenase family protein [Planotetraspora sp. A-T 1434]MCT9932127.1 NAD(P)-binding protein [Planotetraspora sp. A-T 1434]